MIKLENTEVFGWKAAIRGMRNPMNSWNKSDSVFLDSDNVAVEDRIHIGEYTIGEDDLKLMNNLIKSGDDHGKVARYLDVYVDITAPLYWWKEFRTYRKGRKFMDDGDEFFLDPDEFELHIETNSCSTMHKIHTKEFSIDDFSCEHLTPASMELLKSIIVNLNLYRDGYNTCPMKDHRKMYWWQMIQLLPSSYNQKRTVKLNYQVLKNMYHARKNHKLDEWIDFCEWIKTLPYAKELICGE